MHDGALHSWRWLYNCLPMEKGKRIPCFVLLAPVVFALPTKLPLFQPTSSHFYLVILSPILPGRNKQAAVWAWLLAEVKSQHCRRIILKHCSFRPEQSLEKQVYSKKQRVLTFFLFIYHLLSTQTLVFLQDVTKTILLSVSLALSSKCPDN